MAWKYVQYQNGKKRTTSEGGSGGSGHDYSTTEKVVGTWIDGKPLYEKQITFTISFSNVVVGSIYYGESPDLSTLISNIDKVFADSQHSFFEVSDKTRNFIGFNYIDNTKVLNCYAQNAGSNLTAKVIIQYTKTTD